MDTAVKTARTLRLVNHVQVIEAKNGPIVLTPPLNLPHCNTVYYSFHSYAWLAQMF